MLDGAIDKLVAFARRTPAAGIWGGRTLNADLSLNPMSVFGDQTLWSLFCRATGLTVAFRNSPLFNSEHYGGWARDSERDVEVVQGSFFLIPRRLWDELGGFDLSFVMYGEEADLCRRARARGAQPADDAGGEHHPLRRRRLGPALGQGDPGPEIPRHPRPALSAGLAAAARPVPACAWVRSPARSAAACSPG